jgi:hypothetical protein
VRKLSDAIFIQWQKETAYALGTPVRCDLLYAEQSDAETEACNN